VSSALKVALILLQMAGVDVINHNFLRFCQFSAKKLALFLKTDVREKFSNLAFFAQTTHC
jgi:hypothetical protein